MSAITRERLTVLDRALPWAPQPGPQLEAFLSEADQLLYGGAAGGGKTALAIGLALTTHKRTLFIRREGTQLLPAIDEVVRIIGTRDGFNGQERVWRLPGGRQIQFGGVPNLGDETRFMGNPRDLLILDEAANLLEIQAQFLMGWVRSVDPRQRCRTLLCSNPPTSAEGEWLVRWFAPWLDPTFPKPAKPGELRWCAMIPGEGERWVDGPAEFVHAGEKIRPFSRTFIPSRVADNRYLAATDYERQLQALPEPLRSQMLKGDFTAGRQDDEWQVIPSAWVKAAMDRWVATATPGTISSLGVDPSRGGDETIIAVRRGWRFDPLISVAPEVATTGGGIAKKVLEVAGESAPIHIDVIGYGASAADHLEAYVGRRLVPVNFSSAADEKDQTGNFRFANLRASSWWRMRERLAPEAMPKVALPQDQQLFADLCSPRYRLTARGIQIEDKAEIKKRLGRSPDRGDATVLCAWRTPLLINHNQQLPSVIRAAGGTREGARGQV